MKNVRKWFRILHRDIGYFFIGSSLIYGISGIALNHLNDWNPNYSVELLEFESNRHIDRDTTAELSVIALLDELSIDLKYKKHYFPQENIVKVFLKGGSNVIYDMDSGQGRVELLKKRPIFYEVNYLHYNPNAWWMWFSDIFAGALIFLAISSFFILKGKHGPMGVGGIYIIAGFVIPLLLFLLF